jgi:hypothetical protein
MKIILNDFEWFPELMRSLLSRTLKSMKMLHLLEICWSGVDFEDEIVKQVSENFLNYLEHLK